MVVSAGAKHTLFNLAQVLYDHGDEVVIPVPAWGSYVDQAQLCGARAGARAVRGGATGSWCGPTRWPRR